MSGKRGGKIEILRGWQALQARPRGCAVTIGTFDGVHLGHQAMFARLRERAARLKLPATILTFEPMPREFLDAAKAPARLTRLREKLAAFEQAGLDRCVVLRFDERLQTMRAAQFVERLTRDLGAQAIVVGHDFKFAYRGEADVEVLRAAGSRLGFEVEVMEPVAIDGERVSSSAVRAALAAHDLDKAARLLGRRYAMCGRVVRGEQLGRKLGYATANIRLQRRISPLAGIFAVRVRGADRDTERPGVASLGTRPTVGGVEPLLEVHVFDFEGDLYGRLLEVQFVEHLREERKFATLEALVVQMHEDARRAKAVLKRTERVT